MNYSLRRRMKAFTDSVLINSIGCYKAIVDITIKHSIEVTYLLLTQQPLVRFPAFPIFLRGKIINVSEVNQWRCLEESGQWLENVDRTHLVLASGKPVLNNCRYNY